MHHAIMSCDIVEPVCSFFFLSYHSIVTRVFIGFLNLDIVKMCDYNHIFFCIYF